MAVTSHSGLWRKIQETHDPNHPMQRVFPSKTISLSDRNPDKFCCGSLLLPLLEQDRGAERAEHSQPRAWSCARAGPAWPKIFSIPMRQCNPLRGERAVGTPRASPGGISQHFFLPRDFSQEKGVFSLHLALPKY